jgi:hypothetical protein
MDEPYIKAIRNEIYYEPFRKKTVQFWKQSELQRPSRTGLVLIQFLPHQFPGSPDNWIYKQALNEQID